MSLQGKVTGICSKYHSYGNEIVSHCREVLDHEIYQTITTEALTFDIYLLLMITAVIIFLFMLRYLFFSEGTVEYLEPRLLPVVFVFLAKRYFACFSLASDIKKFEAMHGIASNVSQDFYLLAYIVVAFMFLILCFIIKGFRKVSSETCTANIVLILVGCCPAFSLAHLEFFLSCMGASINADGTLCPIGTAIQIHSFNAAIMILAYIIIMLVSRCISKRFYNYFDQ